MEDYPKCKGRKGRTHALFDDEKGNHFAPMNEDETFKIKTSTLSNPLAFSFSNFTLFSWLSVVEGPKPLAE